MSLCPRKSLKHVDYTWPADQGTNHCSGFRAWTQCEFLTAFMMWPSESTRDNIDLCNGYKICPAQPLKVTTDDLVFK